MGSPGGIPLLLTLLPAVLAADPPTDDAARWAPVLYQDLADGLFEDPANRRRDMISAIDFDGNWNPFDNVENADSGNHALTGSVTYDVVETETHLYLLYSIFHAIDWNTTGVIDHENDLEQVWVIVQKKADGSREIAAVATQAHGVLLAWSDTLQGHNGFFMSAGSLDLEGEHPRVFIESKGHGPALCSFPGGLPFLGLINCNPSAAEDMVIYRAVSDAEAIHLTEPEASEALQESGYALVWGHDSLWPLRNHLRQDHDDPPLWEDPFTWLPERNHDGDSSNNLPLDSNAIAGLGSRMAGDEGGGAGTPPWGYLATTDVLAVQTFGVRGDWLLDPPSLHALLFNDPCASEPGFYNFLHHPYLDDLVLPGEPLPYEGIDLGRRCDGQEGGDTSPPDTAPQDSSLPDTAGDDSDPSPPGKPDGCGCSSRRAGVHGLSALVLALLGLLRRAR